MKYKNCCDTCQDYYVCEHYEVIPPERENCPDWKLALALFEELPEEEIDHFPWAKGKQHVNKKSRG